jgi:serpin B
LSGAVVLGLAWLAIGFPGVAAEGGDKAQAARDNNAFALDLYGKLRDRDGNRFFSPESLSTALAMTYAGARGQTADEMARALHFTLGPERLHPAFADLLHDLHADARTKAYQLHVANALWAQKGHPFLPEYVRLVHDAYGAGLEEVDFAHTAEQARRTINAWVEKQTNDKIRDLFAEGTLKPDDRLVLTNAIYFKGDWASPFSKRGTHDAFFHLGNGGTVSVPLMAQTAKFGYAEGDGFQVLELPYAGKDLSMVVFLPKKADGLADLERRLTEEHVRTALTRLRPDEVHVFLPKFKMTAELNLGETLQTMGLKQAFTASADFSGMDGQRDLFLSAVVHKAYVDVNEEGTEAAAATGITITRMAARVSPVFRADHPFVFLIRDTRSGAILFLGRVVNPSV